jgi:dTDP-4-amino-4,6-dideoxygalactose transaminase
MSPVRPSDRSLAILGGQPAFASPLHVGRPNIGDRAALLRRFNEILDQRWLSNHGPMVQALESAIAQRLGVRHCVAMCNGTIALEIAIRALGLEGEVIVPSYTFVATAHALYWQGITPVFADIDPTTHNLDPAAVERMITPRTTGIIGVHLWGRPAPIEALRALAERRGLAVMYDASHAFGCSQDGRAIGHFGRCEVFSFHATKFFNTFEGGAVVTDDDELAARMRLMKNFGFSGYDNVIYPGTNGKMTEVCAAMGLTGLEGLASFTAANRRNHAAYSAGLRELTGVRLLGYGEETTPNYQYVVVEIDPALPLTRDELVRVLHAENVLARRYFWPGCHRMEPYRSLFPHAGLMLPATAAVADRVVVLPTGTAVTETDVRDVCDVIARAMAHAPQVHDRLAAG